MTGFIEPAFDLEMPNIASDNFSHRQLFDFPSVCELLLDDFVVPMSSDTLELQHTFRIIARESLTNTTGIQGEGGNKDSGAAAHHSTSA